MKKTLVIALLAISASMPSMAQHHYHRAGGGWVAPLVGGVVLGAIMARPPAYSQPPVIVQQPPVVIQQPPVVAQQPSYFGSPYKEYYNCLVQVYDPNSGVYRNEVATCVR